MSADRHEEPSPAPPAVPSEPAVISEIRIEPRSVAPRKGSDAPPPRLSIGHLYLWVTCCAVHLAVVRALTVNAEPGLVGLAIVSLYSMVVGAAWAGLVIFLTRRMRRSRWPIEPGEWLLAALGVRLVVEMILAGPVGRAFAAPQTILAAATACVLVLPTFARWPTRWRIFFYVQLALQCVPLASLAVALVLRVHNEGWAEFTVRAPLWGAVVNLVALGVVAYRERAAKTRRTWLHWLGFCLWLLVLGAIPVLAWLASWL